jgi:hypothetical protein
MQHSAPQPGSQSAAISDPLPPTKLIPLPNAITGVSGLVLAAAGNKSISLLNHDLASLKLTLNYFGILYLLGQQGPPFQLVLGEQMGISRASMVHHLKSFRTARVAEAPTQ